MYSQCTCILVNKAFSAFNNIPHINTWRIDYKFPTSCSSVSHQTSVTDEEILYKIGNYKITYFIYVLTHQMLQNDDIISVETTSLI